LGGGGDGEYGIGGILNTEFGMRNAEFVLLLVEGVCFGQDILRQDEQDFRDEQDLLRM
jgi:hypothetical protein